jgi:ubiquinone/menaquinone biosynthesis C-methylase UbiE
MAVEYDRHNASSAANSYYERPATIELLGNVHGKRVLEVGCGTGPLTEWLVAHGAAVVACDVSATLYPRLATQTYRSLFRLTRKGLPNGPTRTGGS